MTDEQKNKMIEKGRIILRPIDSIAHYYLVYFIAVINILTIILGWNQNPPNPTQSTLTNNGIITLTVISMSIMVVFYLIKRERLRLRKQKVDLDPGDILKVIKEVGEQFDWFPTTISKDLIQADSIRILNTDNRITILLRDQEVYINCRTTHGKIGFFRQENIEDKFLTALRMKSYELKHQKDRLVEQASS